MERDKRNELIFQYVQARLKSDAAERVAETARTTAGLAVQAMQEAWRKAKMDNPDKGVYAFKEFGRTCVVLTGGDYPGLTQIIP